jgi:PAS domain S-box-containing protein
MDKNEAILESVSDGVFTVDGEWRITSFNRAASEITGISRAEAMGRHCSEVFRSSMCEGACALRESMETGEPVRNRSGYIVDGLGRRVAVSVSTAVLRSESGEVLGGAEIFRDLSEIESLKNQLHDRYRVGDLVSRSPSMQRVFRLIPAVAASPATVLIEGGTGTGKEVLARAIHSEGPRSGEPFLAVNCGALPDNLLESELFGARKGAYTGASAHRDGRFIAAGAGTLFLDEIGEISDAMQVKLLRVLQERAVTPLGSNSPVPVKARVICATNRSMTELVESGRFRKDLYYRINVVRLELPPLRDRAEDIPELFESLLERHCAAQGRDVPHYDPQILPVFLSHSWPGNIRELENLVERALVLSAGGAIGLSHLPGELVPPERVTQTGTIRSTRSKAERGAILAALERNGFSRTEAAQELGVHKTTLYRRMKALGISLPHRDGRSRQATEASV